MTYNWQQENWPDFKYDPSIFSEYLYVYAERQGLLMGMMKALPEGVGQDTIIDIMVFEAMKTSEIEGEIISRQDVLSSIRNNLGLNKIPERIKDQRAAGVAKLMVSLRSKFARTLDTQLLFQWHEMVMEGYTNINKGSWRTSKEPMQIVSGSLIKSIVHFEAPPSDRLPFEMNRFIKWFNRFEWSNPGQKFHALIHSSIAHLYFESIHPFEDGNGRIGRALSEKLLSEAAGHPIIFSLSKSIENERSAYYNALKQAQNHQQIEPWIQYFIDVTLKAQNDAIEQIQFTIFKAKFFDRIAGLINPRQEKVLSKMLASSEPFEGGMNTKKYISITKSSRATATRDLQELARLNILKSIGGGRSTRYIVNEALIGVGG